MNTEHSCTENKDSGHIWQYLSEWYLEFNFNDKGSSGIIIIFCPYCGEKL